MALSVAAICGHNAGLLLDFDAVSGSRIGSCWSASQRETLSALRFNKKFGIAVKLMHKVATLCGGLFAYLMDANSEHSPQDLTMTFFPCALRLVDGVWLTSRCLLA